VLIKINAKGVVKEDDDDSHNNNTILNLGCKKKNQNHGRKLVDIHGKKDKTQICSSLIVNFFYCVVVEFLVFTFFFTSKALNTIS